MAVQDAQGSPSFWDPGPVPGVSVHCLEQAKHIQKIARTSALNFSQGYLIHKLCKAVDEACDGQGLLGP